MRATDRMGEICDALRRAILEQALKPGTKLPEDSLGERFGVSRIAPLRAMRSGSSPARD